MAWEEKIRTYKTSKGEFPSVTQILSIYDKSGPLMGWAVKMGAEAVKKYLEDLSEIDAIDMAIDIDGIVAIVKNAFRDKQKKALDTGSKVHNAVEVFTKAPSRAVGMKLVTALDEYEQIEKPFSAFVKWYDAVGFKLILGEHPIESAIYRFAGTLDAIAMIEGKKTLADYKASNAIRDDYLWQIAGYDKAYKEMGGEEIEQWGCLRLDKDTGIPEWKTWNADEIAVGFDIFSSIVELWWKVNGHKIKGKK